MRILLELQKVKKRLDDKTLIEAKVIIEEEINRRLENDKESGAP